VSGREAPPHSSSGVGPPLLQRVEIEALPRPHHQFAIEHTVDTDLRDECGLNVGELRGEIIAIARPQPHLTASADRTDAAS
jgi:hypothetical protein